MILTHSNKERFPLSSDTTMRPKLVLSSTTPTTSSPNNETYNNNLQHDHTSPPNPTYIAFSSSSSASILALSTAYRQFATK